jgi:Pyruvate/2-oxoglutarate dehydrogenase complex, dihydrolipoamide dehydrogenase (E3) component, and related enzymes
VLVELTDGRTVEGSHALMTVGTVPNTAGLNLEACGVELRESGHVVVDRVSRTTVPGVYAAGDVTGVFQLASVAAMQGRIAMWHALGEAVQPIRLKTVRPTSSPTRRSPPSASRRRRCPRATTSTSSRCRWRPTPAPR